MKPYTLIPYSIEHFDFVAIVKDLFKVEYLQNIDEFHEKLFEVGNDSKTIFHQMFYDKYRSGWPEMEQLYEAFIEDIAYLYDEDFLYQKFPTFRVHLNNNIAVGDFHNDAEYHHPKGEMNFIIPLTNSYDTASCWIESEPGKKDFEAMPMKVGWVIMFEGNKLTHGNKVNTTGLTRVSMDFRILPISKYNGNDTGGSMTTGTKFVEGQYYKRFTK